MNKSVYKKVFNKNYGYENSITLYKVLVSPFESIPVTEQRYNPQSIGWMS